MKKEIQKFSTTAQMEYANNDKVKSKAESLFVKLKEHLKSVKQDESLFFTHGATVYIPDLHGDFVHLIITLYRHGVLEGEVTKPCFGEVAQPCFHLRKDLKYVFLGDFYDRSPDADVIDFWLNIQIKNNLEIYRLIGNHEMAFFERNEDGYPIIFPSQDSIKDASNDFRITENLLKNIAEGNILATYVGCGRDLLQQVSTLYVHSYVINDDYIELGLEQNTSVVDFAIALNKRFKQHGQDAYNVFLNCKKEGKYNWKEIMKPFKDDPLFDIHKRNYDIHTSFIWRRTNLPVLNVYPAELDVKIPDDVYQIVGHTPVFLFNIPRNQSSTYPFLLSSKMGTGKIQFSDVGIGYYYKKDDFERPEVVINSVFAIRI